MVLPEELLALQEFAVKAGYSLEETPRFQLGCSSADSVGPDLASLRRDYSLRRREGTPGD